MFLSSYDIVGDIAVLRILESSQNVTTLIAKVLMRRHGNIKTVLKQVGGISGDLRLRRLEWIAGERKSHTTYKEFGCIINVDLEKCYFSPRLSHERMRVARLVKPDETVVNMFAGVGSFSVLIARHSKARKVYSIDVNPEAIKLMQENARLNRAESKVVSIEGDAKDAIVNRLRGVADRVLMPLPNKAFAYLDYAIMALKPLGGWIHYYTFEHASKNDDPVEKAKAKVNEKLRNVAVGFTVSSGRVVRSTGPNWYQVVLDVHVDHR